MQVPRLQKIAKRVILLQTNGTGTITPVTVFNKNNRKKKKCSPGLRGAERLLKRWLDAEKAFSARLADRSRASRRKKRDGLLRDLGRNVFRALKAGRKKLRMQNFP